MDYVSQLRPCPHGLSWIDKRENLLTMTRLIPLQPSGNTEKRLKPDKVGSSFHHVSPSSADSKSEDQTLPCFVEGFWLSTLGSEEHNAKSIIRWHMGHWHTMIRHLHYIGSTLVQSVFLDITQLTVLYSCLKKMYPSYIIPMENKSRYKQITSWIGVGWLGISCHRVICFTAITMYHNHQVISRYIKSNGFPNISEVWTGPLLGVTLISSNDCSRWFKRFNLQPMETGEFYPTSGQQNTSLQGLNDLKPAHGDRYKRACLSGGTNKFYRHR